MHNFNIPNDRELPSTKKLVKSTILAALSALVILIAIVMPAEYGIDPTGAGSVLGLTKMGEIKMSLATEAEEEAIMQEQMASGTEVMEPEIPEEIPLADNSAPSMKSDEISITLEPDEGKEVKVTLAQGKTVEYSWATNGGKANFDVHGDSKELEIDYHSYSKGSEQQSQGTITAAFDGNHGWFWRNRTDKLLTVTLKTNGEYTDIKEMK